MEFLRPLEVQPWALWGRDARHRRRKDVRGKTSSSFGVDHHQNGEVVISRGKYRRPLRCYQTRLPGGDAVRDGHEGCFGNQSRKAREAGHGSKGIVTEERCLQECSRQQG